jgi:ABC-2 type transport system ATP-binding protein
VSGVSALRTDGLGKCYGTTWALKDCTLEIPTGSVIALVGPNGAGKTTLLHLLIGLGQQTAGTIRVLGLDPRAEACELLPKLGFVAQDHPLYRGLSIEETFKLGRHLNPHWNESAARARIEGLGINLSQKVGKLSGGQQAQVALTLALAKEPELLVLDEPVASLDPLARREFLNAVLEAAVEDGVSVILSSHIVAELERVCDYLVTLADGRPQLVGPIREIVASHRLLIGPRGDDSSAARVHNVIRESHIGRQSTLLVRANGHVYDTCWEQHEVDLEEIVLAYLGYQTGATTSAPSQPELVAR